MSFPKAALTPVFAVIAFGNLFQTPANAQALKINPSQVRLLNQEYASCIVAKPALKVRAIKFLLDGQKKTASKITSPECLYYSSKKYNSNGVTGRWSHWGFRALIANALAFEDYKVTGPTDFAQIKPLVYDPEAFVPMIKAKRDKEQIDEIRDQQIILAQLGECVARSRPESVRLVAITPIESAAEVKALNAVAPSVGECLPSGLTLKFAPGVLRDSLVVAYARLAYSLQQSAVSPSPAKGAN